MIDFCPPAVQPVLLPSPLLDKGNPNRGVPHVPTFHSLLCDWPYNFPLESFWIVLITPKNSDYLYSQISAIGQLEIKGSGNNGSSWQISNGLNLVTDEGVARLIGCAFAAGISTPDDGFGISFAGGEHNRGFLKGPIGNHRQELAAAKIIFTENNSSIVDNFIRPWMALASHRGTFAYPEGQSIKADISCFMFRKDGVGVAPKCRKRITYFDALPHQVPGEELTREESASISTRACSFAYNGYTMSDGSDHS